MRIVLKRKKLIAAITISALAIGYLWYLADPARLYGDCAHPGRSGSRESSKKAIFPVARRVISTICARNWNCCKAAIWPSASPSIANLSAAPEPEKSSGFSLFTLFGGKPENARPTAAPARNDVGVGAVLGGRASSRFPGSRLIDISFTDPSPQRAQRVANAFGEAFINFNLDKRLESNAYAKTFLDDQIKQLKIRLQDAEKAMIDFAQKEQLIASNDKDSKASSNFDQVSAALSVATAERIRNELQWKQVEAANAINLPQLLTNATISQLRAARGALTAEYQEKSTTYGPNYPAMVEIKNKIAEIDRQLAAEVKTIKASYKAAYEASARPGAGTQEAGRDDAK